MKMLILFDGLCFVGFMSPVGVQKQILVHLSTLHVKKETECSLRNVAFLNKKQDYG
jgi:hypothetical protein